MLEPIPCCQVLADYKLAAICHGMGYHVTHRVSLLNLVSTVPVQYHCWINLIYNQIMMPRVSFTGHFCGILAGLVHVFLPKAGKTFGHLHFSS